MCELDMVHKSPFLDSYHARLFPNSSLDRILHEQRLSATALFHTNAVRWFSFSEVPG